MQHTNNNSANDAKVEEENQWMDPDMDMDVLMTLPIPVLQRSRNDAVGDYAPLIHDAVWSTVIEPQSSDIAQDTISTPPIYTKFDDTNLEKAYRYIYDYSEHSSEWLNNYLGDSDKDSVDYQKIKEINDMLVKGHKLMKLGYDKLEELMNK